MAKKNEIEIPVADREDLEFYAEDIELEYDEDISDEELQDEILSRIDSMEDDDWKAMDGQTKSWSNDINKIKRGEATAEELGMVEAEPEPEEEPEAEPEAEEEPTRKKAPAKKKPAAKKPAKKAPAKKPAKEPTKKELADAKARAKEKAETRKRTHKTAEDYIGQEWKEGSSAQECLNVMKAALKTGITVADAASIAEGLFESANHAGRVATIFRVAVSRDLAEKKENGNYVYTGDAGLKPAERKKYSNGGNSKKPAAKKAPAKKPAARKKAPARVKK